MVSELKNYTTTISAEKSISEIEMILAQHGATDIYKQYNNSGQCISLSFAIIGQGPQFFRVGYRLPLNVKGLHQVMKNMKKEGKLKNISKENIKKEETARRVGWRIIRDWIHAQMALIESEIVTIDQVFLPFACVDENRTVYDVVKDKEFLKLDEPRKVDSRYIDDNQEKEDEIDDDKIIDIDLE